MKGVRSAEVTWFETVPGRCIFAASESLQGRLGNQGIGFLCKGAEAPFPALAAGSSQLRTCPPPKEVTDSAHLPKNFRDRSG